MFTLPLTVHCINVCSHKHKGLPLAHKITPCMQNYHRLKLLIFICSFSSFI